MKEKSEQGETTETVSGAPQAPSKSRRLENAIGRQIRLLRNQQGLQLTSLAERAGISAALVSRIEHGGVSPSLHTLDQIAAALSVPITHLFTQAAPRRDASLVRKGEGLNVTRSGTSANQLYQLLGATLDGDMHVEPYLITLGKDSECNAIFHHDGIEFIHMLKGSLVYRHGEEDHTLKPGDSLMFDARLAHGTVELLKLPAQFLSVIAYHRG